MPKPINFKTESQEQAEFVNWFGDNFPDTVLIATPNGAQTTGRNKSKLKTQGLAPGTPDIFIPEWRLWIEFKRSDGGKLSPEQEAMIEYLRGVGYLAEVAHGCEQAKQIIATMAHFYVLDLHWTDCISRLFKIEI